MVVFLFFGAEQVCRFGEYFGAYRTLCLRMMLDLQEETMKRRSFPFLCLSMVKTLERYQKCNYGAPEPNISTREALVSTYYYMELSSQQEYLKLKARYEALQRSQRNLLGEDLGPLNSKELESLERQLDMSLKQIRSTRTQVMLDQLTDLQRKEHALNEANKTLKQRLMEGNQVNLQWNPNAQDVGYGRQPAHAQGDGFFHPLDCEPTLQIGYQNDAITVAAAGPSVNNYMAGWLP
ncbi:agamous-like MADS-box protein AGL9 homolog isoform X7 [Coffea arabica]|uniref:Agamous-like MADS-box protein AGL9 homolog isoform X7 n=1 Tax=Coffea arabica TaxID=13443 RepID=A0ABM4WAA1_COFAR